MANYRYTATDASGKWVSGEVRAVDRAEAEARLSAEGMAVEGLAEAEADPEPSRVGPISGRDSVELVRQLSDLVRSGLPLPSGLRAAGQELASPRLRSIFLGLADRVEAGDGLDAALASGRDAFPAHLRGLILAGSRSGRLADVLGEYVRAANLAAELRRRLWAVVAYPAFVAAATLALMIFVCNLSVVAADTLIGDLPTYLVPGDTRPGGPLVLMARFVASHWHEGLLIAATAVGGAWVVARVGLSAAARRRLACAVPVIGPARRFTSMAEFSRLMAMLLEADLPLPEALELAGASVRDADVAEACGRMGRAVSAGQPLSSAVRLWDSIPAGLGQLFRWSEGHRSLPEALRLAGEMFEARARSQTSLAANFLGVLLVLLILWWVGFALATLYLPLLTLIGRLSG